MAANFASHTIRRGPYLGGKSGNAAGPPAQEPRRQGPPFRILSARRPPCYPHPSMLGRRSRISMARLADVPLPRLVRCSTLSEGGKGGDVVSSCWGVPAFFLPSTDPLLESSPPRSRTPRGPARAITSHTCVSPFGGHLRAAQEVREALRGPSNQTLVSAFSRLRVCISGAPWDRPWALTRHHACLLSRSRAGIWEGPKMPYIGCPCG